MSVTIDQEILNVAQQMVESQIRITEKEIEVVKASLEALKTAFKGLEETGQKNLNLKNLRNQRVKDLKEWLKAYARGHRSACSRYQNHRIFPAIEMELSKNGY